MGKNKQRKSGKDKITGLYIDFNGSKIESDKIYGVNSPNGLGPLKDTDFSQYELELSKRAIALTFTGGEDNWKRYALTGNFRYNKKGALQSSKTNEFADWTHSPGNEWILVFQKPPSKASPYEIFSGFSVGKVFEYDSDYLARGIPSNEKSAFFQYQSSALYQEGWWQDPFEPNLI